MENLQFVTHLTAIKDNIRQIKACLLSTIIFTIVDKADYLLYIDYRQHIIKVKFTIKGDLNT